MALQLVFDEGRALRLRVAANGEQMIVDDGPLVSPYEMDEYGEVDIADVTQALYPALRGVDVANIEALAWNSSRVGIKLNLAGGEPFHFWVDGDELRWGDGAAIASHEWLGSLAPMPSERIEI